LSLNPERRCHERVVLIFFVTLLVFFYQPFTILIGEYKEEVIYGMLDGPADYKASPLVNGFVLERCTVADYGDYVKNQRLQKRL
jgi:hypothetical protein